MTKVTKKEAETVVAFKGVAGIVAIVVLALGAYIFGDSGVFGPSCIEQTMIATTTDSQTYQLKPVECPEVAEVAE